ncbi:hypothetical protein Avbf_15692 [Armadillidium vulgare]|nr:hypothetical protein Avbf_12631 [Armadillidium vulgare]RXG65403.1 hypothetical protein Avbf_16704 [Armadillidium vulgare]RXG66869.1 hypothetical protein Avbf_15692 [Armadillidium vulgare]
MNFMQTRSTSYESDLHNLQNKNSTSFLPHNAVFLDMHSTYPSCLQGCPKQGVLYTRENLQLWHE